ncbi:DNA-3-methyladenine glycosylase I [Sulfuriroseicoccus oceanibius]|uniref:DNA-3-methyladenine glycosylase I n=1 Tax=Sulfuriroseicoccus oceanibius TaxID=2707525 RepID=A0A6B3LB84_9BACT|nr:DNA-3-methyladenine glycosylase I [Sulfuriroseicoccus oceanibius]QQL44205.1 DNA-3-methyladenine glycosylase I [Sulfuriroseicoccus oceanibius]
MKRCPWVTDDPIYIEYHDHQWGVPVHDDRMLFEMLILEGAQAGLSWLTVLKKRDNYRRIFHNFEIDRVAAMTDTELEEALLDPGIIRNRLKVTSARRNALAAQKVIAEFGSLDTYFWQWVDGQPIVNRPKSLEEYAATSEISDALSKDLKKRGFNFVGSTIIYAFMQAIGMMDDHSADCALAHSR